MLSRSPEVLRSPWGAGGGLLSRPLSLMAQGCSFLWFLPALSPGEARGGISGDFLGGPALPPPHSCFQLARWQRGSWPRGLESGQNPPVPSFQILFDFIFSDTRVLYTVGSITSDLPKHTSPSFANRLGLRVMIRDAPKFQNPRTGRWSNQATYSNQQS